MRLRRLTLASGMAAYPTHARNALNLSQGRPDRSHSCGVDTVKFLDTAGRGSGHESRVALQDDMIRAAAQRRLDRVLRARIEVDGQGEPVSHHSGSLVIDPLSDAIDGQLRDQDGEKNDRAEGEVASTQGQSHARGGPEIRSGV